VYERENMAHLSLCFDKYISKEKIVDEDVRDEKLAIALFQLGGLKYYWDEYCTAADLLKLSVRIYENLLPEKPEAELGLLIAMQQLANIYISRDCLDSNFKDAGALNDMIVNRLKKLLPNHNFNVLWGESLQATCLIRLGNLNEALKLYQRCIENNAKGLEPGHP
jgi:tetratricopeptide (TPR) repeat protein